MTGMTASLVLVLIVAAAAPAAGTRHILFAFVDHFEPTGSVPGPEVSAWVDDYMAMASHHTDADGRHPIHSYFVLFGSVPVDKTATCVPAIDPGCLEGTLIKLNQATYAGYGEVEFHCHHGLEDECLRTEQDAASELLDLIAQARNDFNRHGALVTAELAPRFTFGFIHGEWALDNSRFVPSLDWDPPHRQFCGVNRELSLLSQQGAYADFTFPAWGNMEPRIHNAIFYAADDELPDSYKNWTNVRPVEVGQGPWGDLMIVQGPRSNPNIAPPNNWPTIARMYTWVAANVHVVGNDEWIFVKVHTHGCASSVAKPLTWQLFFGATMDWFYRDLESQYNDGFACKLHYVSAREMYNIIKAAEAGKTGDPNAYRDYLIPPYANMKILSPNRYRLVRYDTSDVIVELLDELAFCDMSLKEFPADATVFEADADTGPWQRSDGFTIPGPSGELHLFDRTPSSFYYFTFTP